LNSLESEELSDTQVLHQFIDGIRRGAGRLKQILDAMLDMSLIEAGALNIEFTAVSPEALVENAVLPLERAIEQRGLCLWIQNLSALPQVSVDPARLEQVLVGLLSNAIKFTPDGGEISVRGQVISSSKAESWVELSIRDTGIGLAPDQCNLIFEKFYRGEDLLRHSTDDVAFKGAGPGLGLAIARGIVNAHGGRIWAESQGRDEERCPGTTFFVRLPVDRPGVG
jgi:signal transduction histidine kinase